MSFLKRLLCAFTWHTWEPGRFFFVKQCSFCRLEQRR